MINYALDHGSDPWPAGGEVGEVVDKYGPFSSSNLEGNRSFLDLLSSRDEAEGAETNSFAPPTPGK